MTISIILILYFFFLHLLIDRLNQRNTDRTNCVLSNNLALKQLTTNISHTYFYFFLINTENAMFANSPTSLHLRQHKDIMPTHPPRFELGQRIKVTARNEKNDSTQIFYGTFIVSLIYSLTLTQLPLTRTDFLFSYLFLLLIEFVVIFSIVNFYFVIGIYLNSNTALTDLRSSFVQSNAGIIYDDWNGTEQPYNKDAAVYLEALTLTSSYAQRCVPRQHEIIVNKIKEKNRSYEDEDEEFNPLKTPTTVSKFKGLKKLMSLKQHVDISVNKTLSKYSLQTPDGSFKIRKKIVNNAIAKTNSELNVLTLRSNTSYQRSVSSSSSSSSSSSAATAVTTGAESSVPEMTTKVTKMSGFKVLDTLSASSTWSSWSSSSSVAIAAASNGNTETTMINTKELNFLHSQQQEILQEICNSKAGYARLEQMHNKLIATTTASNEVS